MSNNNDKLFREDADFCKYRDTVTRELQLILKATNNTTAGSKKKIN